jgi:hypothetical protein
MDTKLSDTIMEFDRDFETQEVMCKQLGRLRLGDGSLVRLVLLPDGLHIMVRKDSKFVHLHEGFSNTIVRELGTFTDDQTHSS